MSLKPPPYRARLRLLCALPLLLCCAACGAPGPATPATPATAPAAAGSGMAPLEQLRRLAAGAECDDSAQCHTVAVGQRPCGGPEAYLPWSSRTASAIEVSALAGRDRAQRASAALPGVVSDCRLVTDPGAECRAVATAVPGQCHLRTPLMPGQSDPR